MIIYSITKGDILISISGLTKSFDDICVLRDINLAVNKGDIYGLVGLSGAGKSTLLRCINGLETFDQGVVLVNGVNVKECIDTGRIRSLRKSIGMIFQHFSLLERMTAYENIALPMACWKYGKSEINGRVMELLGLVGLDSKRDAKPRELSGGQKQRVAVARALTMNPEILLCDEATSALDPITTESILSLLREINEKMGVTIVIVTHEMSVVKQVCNKIAVLENGEICSSGSVEDIFLRRSHALDGIVQNNYKEQFKDTGVNIRIIFSGDNGENILSKIAMELGISYRVNWCSYDKYRDSTKGYYIINVGNDEKSRVFEYLATKPVEFEEIGGNGAC